MTRGVCGIAVFLMVAASGGVAQDAAAPNALVPRAWIRFVDAAQKYAEMGYLFLGDGEIRLVGDSAPAKGDVLELLWGAKNDARSGVLVINGKRVALAQGGYDGFRWLRIPVPADAGGATYDILLAASWVAAGRPGFVAEVRISAPGMALPDLTQKAVRMRREMPEEAFREAYAQFACFWDGEPPAPATPLPDARGEALFRQAARNAGRASEQFFRCRRFVEGWLANADPVTGLIPRNLGESRDIWNAQDSAADNYPFMVLTCALTDQALFNGRMRQILETESRLLARVDRLPDTWSFSARGFKSAAPNLPAIIFGASEYAKDGLIPLTEWLGESPWSSRMLELVDDIWKHATVATPFGPIPSDDPEVNGDLLQVLARTFWMTGDKKYLEWGFRLADYYLLGTNHPARDFTQLKLRDHGCEITGGLSEVYVAAHFVAPEKKKAYEAPIHAMFDRILEVGRNEHGMLYNWIDPRTGAHDAGLCDTWGYNYNGMYAVHLIDKTESYPEAVRKVLGNLHAHYRDFDWGSADEYADCIEGALNLYNRERVASTEAWLDGEIRDMWRRQTPDGVIEGWHGDGNSARTAIMYALWKTKGVTVKPWRADVRIGAEQDGDTLYVSVVAHDPWTGTCVFDRPRHKENLHLPLDYPRINQFPEWFTVAPDRRYEVREAGSAEKAVHTGAALARGLLLALSAETERRLIVTPAARD
jgi:hypothetical protein